MTSGPIPTSVPLEVGDNLPTITKQITQDKIDRYADASGDHNPLHVDANVASASPFEGTIAHGMLILAYISEMMTSAFGGSWDGAMKVRFRAPARPGDKVIATGRVASVDQKKGARFTLCDVECRNQHGEVLVSGTSRAVRWGKSP